MDLSHFQCRLRQSYFSFATRSSWFPAADWWERGVSLHQQPRRLPTNIYSYLHAEMWEKCLAQGHFTYHWSCRIQNGWLLSFFFFSHLMHCQVNRYYSVMCYCSLMQWDDLSKQLWTRSIGLSKFKIWSEFASSSFKTAAIWMRLCLFFFKNSASSENVEPKGSSSTLDESESPSPQLQQGEKISQVSW